MTHIEALKLMAYLAEMYDKSLSEERVNGYAEALRMIPCADGMRAARIHVARSQFFPTVAELLAPIAEAAVGREPAEQAWVEVMRAVRAVGRYGAWRFDNPITAATVEAIGKENICNSTDLVSERSNFLRIYASYHGREIDAARTAPMLGMEYRPRIGGPRPVGELLLPGRKT